MHLLNRLQGHVRLGPWYSKAIDSLGFLKVIEYTGPTADTDSNCYSTSKAHIDVQIYEIYNDEPSFEEVRSMPEAEIVYLPHVKFDGLWDEYCSFELLLQPQVVLTQLCRLVFEEDYKRDLIWTMTNTCKLPKGKAIVLC